MSPSARRLDQIAASDSFHKHREMESPPVSRRSDSRFDHVRVSRETRLVAAHQNTRSLSSSNATSHPKPCFPLKAAIKRTCTCSLMVSSRTAFSSLLVFISTVSTTSESSFLRSLAASSVNLRRKETFKVCIMPGQSP